MSWPLVKLSEVAQVNPRLPKDVDETQEVIFLPMAAISEQGQILEQEKRILSETRKGFTYFEKNDVVVAKITPCFENGKAAFLDDLETQIGFGTTEFHVIRPDIEKLDGKYLFYLVWNKWFRHLGERNMSGSAGQKRVPTDFLKGLEIPLPPLDEQKRIAAILDKADAIRRKRQQAINLADVFLRSVFIDMFGDPVTNSKRWGVKKFADIGTLDRGKSKHRPRNDPKLLGGNHPLIQTGDVANSKGYIKSYKSTYSDLGLKQSRKWSAGTLCITIAANIAKTGILTFDACFPDSVVGFKPNEQTTTEYVQVWIGFLQKILEANAPESAQKNINLAILRDLDIPLPPINEQQKFSDIVEKLNELKLKAEEGQLTDEKVFNSLSQKAFAGEL